MGRWVREQWNWWGDRGCSQNMSAWKGETLSAHIVWFGCFPVISPGELSVAKDIIF